MNKFRVRRIVQNTSESFLSDEESSRSSSAEELKSDQQNDSTLDSTLVHHVDDESSNDSEQPIRKSGRGGRHLTKARIKYLDSDSEASNEESFEDPEDPSFGKQKKRFREFNLIPKVTGKAQVIQVPKLKMNIQELDSLKPLKQIDTELFDANQSTVHPLKRKNQVKEDNDSEDVGLPSDDLKNLLTVSDDSNGSSLSSWLPVPKKSTLNGTPKRKKQDYSDDDDDDQQGKSAKKKVRKSRIKAFPENDDESSIEPIVSSGSSKENQSANDDDVLDEDSCPPSDDLRVIFEDDDFDHDSDYSNDDIVLDTDDDFSDDEIKSSRPGREDVFNMKQLIIDLLNNGTEADLLNIPTITKKKLDILITLRPFTNWSDVVNKFENTGALPHDMFENVKNNAKARHIISVLLTKCKGMSDKIKDTVKNLKGLRQPKILNRKLQLKPYQLIGLNWMALMQEKGINGILADEMGLGKTIQVIALLAHLRVNKQMRGPHLIVVPASILANWSREFQTWCPTIKVLEYHGSQNDRADLRQQVFAKEIEFDVILTTYNLCYSTEDQKLFKRTKFMYIIFDEAHMLKNMKTARFKNLFELKSKYRLMLTGTPIQNNLLELMSLLLFTMPQFFSSKTSHIETFFKDKRIENDSGNFVQSRIDQAKEILNPFILRRLKENVLLDLPSKIQKYEQITMTDNQRAIYEKLIKDYQQQFQEMREERLKLKKDKPEQKVAILEHKRKRNVLTYDEDKLQDVVHKDGNSGTVKTVCISESSNDSVLSVTSDESDEIVKTNIKKSSHMLMELRKCANHPLLIRTVFTDERLMDMARTLKQKEEYYRKDGNVQYIFEDMQVMNDFDLHVLCKRFKSIEKHKLSDDQILDSGKFKYLNELLSKLIEEGNRVLIFSQFQMMLDILEEYLKIRKIRFCRLDGATKVTDRMGIIDNFYENKEIFVFLITTKAGGLGINLVEANHVVIHDIDFNPYNDKQAEDRAHRMGQKKDVHVFKLVSNDSIEINMMNTCLRKLEVGRTITSDHTEADKASDARDIKAMLKLALKIK